MIKQLLFSCLAGVVFTVPQYILFNGNGQVLRRWDGIRHYDKTNGSGQLAEFFQPR